MSKKKKEPAQCPKCDTMSVLTDEHIVPQWLTKRMEMFGISMVIIGNKERICQPCNSKKGGEIDYKDPRVKEFIKAFIGALQNKVK